MDPPAEHGPAGPDGQPPLGRGLRGMRAALEGALPAARYGDHLRILSGTGQNIAGLAVFVLATLGTNILIARVLGPFELGQVTLATQFAFIAGAATRFGMDMAAVRRVAIDVGMGRPGQARGVMIRAVSIAAAVSAVVAILVFGGAGYLADQFSPGSASRDVFRAAALALPFVALSQVYLGGTRGLKIMRHTLLVYWIGQPLAWIALMTALWLASETSGATVLAYAGSWILATALAAFLWYRETRAYAPLPPEPGETRELLRYGVPRAPAALLSQLLFWADYFVLARTASPEELGVYAAAVRVAQALVLFLVAVNYMFSPFVADLHARGERERLDSLYKALTRWVVAGTIPILLVLLILPGPVLRAFGGEFGAGTTPLRILLVGQLVNVAVGSVGFILIMVGRTGWDLAVYAGSFAIDVLVALVLAPRLGAEGAATAQAITLVVANAARVSLVWRLVGIQPFTAAYARLGIPAVIGAVAMTLVHLLLRGSGWALDLAASAIVGGIVYLGALVAVGLTTTERAVLARALGRRAATS